MPQCIYIRSQPHSEHNVQHPAPICLCLIMKFSQPLLVAVFGLTCTVSTAPTAQVETSIVKRMAPWSATDKAAILAVVNKFDAAYGIPKKNWSASLYSDTVLCGQADNGVNENHCGPVSPFTGSWAQVIAPGQ